MRGFVENDQRRLAMIFGMLPLVFAIEAGAEMRAPMARAVIGVAAGPAPGAGEGEMA